MCISIYEKTKQKKKKKNKKKKKKKHVFNIYTEKTWVNMVVSRTYQI